MRWRHAVLLGHPVAHSISPRFQQAAFDHLGLDVRYEAWETREADLPQRLATLRGDSFIGANVTVPHKQRALVLVDVAQDAARVVGATNCLLKQGEELIAANTDVDGFRRSLREDAHFDARGRRAVVFGAGGAARAVVFALLQDSAAEVLVLNRSPERAASLVTELAPHGTGELWWQPQPSGDELEWLLRRFELVINCTSLGLAGSPQAGTAPVPEPALPRGALVVDIIANPLLTPLLRAARRRGCATLGGLSMLVYQGAAAFELWTGLPAPLGVMMDAARAAMGLR